MCVNDVYMYIHVCRHVSLLLYPGCVPTVTKTELPKGCWLDQMNNEEDDEDMMGEMLPQTSFYQGICSMEECTTGGGSCMHEDDMCCCRPQKINDLFISCDNQNLEMSLDQRVKKNESQCECIPCNDVIIKVRLSVKGQGDDGPIPAAQIFNLDTEEIIGLTLYNGILDFEVGFNKRKLQVLIQATGYQRVTRVITLSPKHTMVIFNITMTRIFFANIGPGDSEIVFPLGKMAWLYASPGTFHKNGTTHKENVVFKGSYVDPSTSKFLDLIESESFEVEDGERFAMVAAVFLEFEDEEGEQLDVRDLRLAVPIDKEEEVVDGMFAVVHDWETGTWTRISTFSPIKTKRGKRSAISSVICEAPDITVAQLVAIAMPLGADCWVQVRTFDQNLDPFPGALVTLVQRRFVGGIEVIYRIGTDTGGAQTTDESLASNAVCLPLDCNDFLEVNISARFEPNSQLVPVDFPPDTFVGDLSEPIIENDIFFLVSITPAEVVMAARPFYVFPTTCMREAQEPDQVANPSDYFSFATDYLPFEPNTDQCYIKITISNCFFRANVPKIITMDAQTGVVTSSQTFPELFIGVPALGSGFPEECFEYNTSCPSMCAEPRSMCLPFRCGDIVQVSVMSNLTTNGELSTCELINVSPILGDLILAYRDSNNNQNLTIDSSVLDPASFNDPELGLYYDPQPTRARQLCNGGGTIRGYTNSEGSVAHFGCFTDND